MEEVLEQHAALGVLIGKVLAKHAALGTPETAPGLMLRSMTEPDGDAAGGTPSNFGGNERRWS
jgi:hypothetical protein